MNCRGLRLELVAGLGIALAMPALAAAADTARGLTTQTTLSAESRDQGGSTQAAVAVTVTGEDGLPVSGAVVIEDHGSQLAGAALNGNGEARLRLDLPAGDHSLRAVYQGDATHLGSVSEPSAVHALATPVPDFKISIKPVALSLAVGASGTVVASVTPVNSSALSAPMFVTLSCSGFPDQSSCSFTPENVEILPNATIPLTSNMLVVTQLGSSSLRNPAARQPAHPVAWALLLPGALGLMGLAWGSRRRAWLSRLSLLVLVGLVSILGATACNSRYDYFNHGPPPNPPTPAGTYTIDVTAQSSNGITAITHTTTLALTVQ
jgi:hypothetical protein